MRLGELLGRFIAPIRMVVRRLVGPLGSFLQDSIDRLGSWRASGHREPNTVVHMFVDDVYTWIVPYGPLGRAIAGRLTGDEAHVAVATATLRSMANHAHEWALPEETIPDVVRTVVQHLLWRGYAAFVIDAPTEATDGRRHIGRGQRDGVVYRPLRPLPHGWLFRTPFGVVEILAPPDRFGAHWKLVRLYSRRRLWFVDVPRSLGGRWGYWWMLRRFGFFADLFPKWSSQAIVQEHAKIQFDVAAYSRLKAAYHAVSASRWGWSVRDVSTTYQTEFLAVYRTLTFHHSLAVLRESVLEALNRLMAQRLELDVYAELTGAVTPSVVAGARDRLEQGELPFLDALREVGAI